MTHYIIPHGSKSNIPIVTSEPSFHVRGLYPGNYGIYTKDFKTRKLSEPVTYDWVTSEQIRCEIPVHPFTHSTLGLESDEWYRPPFHVQVIHPFLYRSDIMESVWLVNDTSKYPTRELDLSESGRGWYGRRLWMADHWGGIDYEPRYMDAVEILCPPKKVSQIDIFVFNEYAIRYLNGPEVKVSYMDLNYDFRLLATMLVLNPNASDCDWNVQKIAIRRL